MMKTLRKWLMAFFVALTATSAMAQDDRPYVLDTTVVAFRDTLIDKQVVTNPFNYNWFAKGVVGMHKFEGDFNELGKFSDTVSPDWWVGIGKWFSPNWGMEVEFGMGQSHGFTTPEHKSAYTREDVLYHSKDGQPYYRQRIKWMDLNFSVMLNLTRVFLGYEGSNSPKRLNQFIAGFGIGAVHHYGFEKGNPKLNEWSGHLDLQYSRFLNKKKNFSIDLRARFLFYQTNFDRNFDFPGCHNWDRNYSIGLGFTYFITKNVWNAPDKIAYQTVYKTRDVYNTYYEEAPAKKAEFKTFTFYVRYPDAENHNLINLAKTSAFNDHNSIGEVRRKGYKGDANDALYSLADVYAAVMQAKNETPNVPGSDNAAVQQLKNILNTDAMVKITVMSTTAAMNYYSNDPKQHQQNAKNVDLANARANEVVEMLKQAPRMNTATPNIMLVNSLDTQMDQCMKVTVQYLSQQ